MEKKEEKRIEKERMEADGSLRRLKRPPMYELLDSLKKAFRDM